jgi:hypothetical protein
MAGLAWFANRASARPFLRFVLVLFPARDRQQQDHQW